MLAAFAFAPIPQAFAAFASCDTPAADCEILNNRTYTDPNTYDYTNKNSLDLMTTGSTSPTITQLGGTVIAKQLGLWNSVTYNMSGGTANISGDVIVSIYSFGAVTSYFTQSGGTLNAGGNLRFSVYTGNTGIYTLSGGNINVGGRVNLVESSTTNATARFYLNGGTLTANEIDRDGDSVGQQTTAELRFNGGTLRAKGDTDNPNWINFNNGWNQRYNTTVLAIDAGGAIFDTNGRSMGIQQPLPVAFSLGSQISPDISGGGVTKRGAGTLTLSAGNAYTGNTVVEAGTLTLANVNAVVNSTVMLNGGTLSFNAITNATLGGLGGSQNFTLQNTAGAAVALAVSNNGASTTYSGAMSGPGSLNKIGGGTLILGGINTYGGTTSVSSGTLRVNGATGGGALGVAANATLGGNGSVNGSATIQSNGHLAPGNSPGTLTFTNGLALNGGAVLDLELGTSSDLVRVSGGTFASASGVTINVTDSGGFGYGNYTLIDFTGATPSGIGASNFTLGTKPAGNYLYNLSVQGTKLMLNVAPVPPTVISVSGPADGLYGIGKPLDFTVHFSAAMTVTGTPRVVLIVPAWGTQYANYVSGSGTADLVFRYIVPVNTPDNTSGIVIADNIDVNGGTLRDAAGTDAVLTLNNKPSLANVILDGTAPKVSSIKLVGTPAPTSLTVSYTVTFSETVTGVGAGAFNVETVDGSATGQLGTVSGSGGTYTVVVTRIGGVGHLFLTLKNSGTGIADLAGNATSGGYRLGDQFQANVQRRCYVNKAAAGANDGTSWTDAYTDLQSAVRDAGCVEIWTAKGVYKPGSATTDSFQPRAGQKIYGGFAGVEAALTDRTLSVIAANPTVMSGDIDGNDTTDANGVVLDAAQIVGSNSVNVVLMNNGGAAGYGPDTVIDGFVITAGDASGTTGLGGGLRCDASLIQASCGFTLSNLVFSGNRAVGGGALSLTSSSGTANAVVSKVLFRGNRAVGLGGSGGAVSLSAPPAAGRVSPAFSNVVFSGNSSSNWGGAIDLNVNLGTVTPTFDNATFTGNVSSVRRGGAISSEAYGTGGVATPTLRNSILWSDAANAGDPEIVFASNGAVVLDHSIVQGGCPSGNATCTNMVTGDPKLGALGNYGGAVPSLLPGGGSAAIDTGTCQLPDDIRGVSRPQGAGCDIGAVESRLSVLTATVSGGGSVSAGAAPVPMTGSITNCTSSCSATYDGEAQPTVTLTATANAQQSFSAWSGDCSGSNPVTTVAMTVAKTCTATFAQNLTQTTLVLGSGSSPSAYGMPLSFTAAVAAVAPATQAPTGNVNFYYGSVLLGTQALNGAGTATFATSALSAGTHSITAQYGGDANYAVAAQPPSAALTQIVSVITPTMTWSTPGPIVYGTPLSAAQLSATATYNGNPVAGTFVYAPLAGSVLPAGNGQTLSVTFTPIDTTNYTSATASVQINVTRAPLSVTGTIAQNKPYDGTATATLSAGALVGVIPADAGNVNLTQAGTFAQTNTGTAIAVTANDSIGGSAAVNYTLTQPAGLSANITPLTLTYKATPATIAYGTTPSGLSGTLSGFISGESQATATTGTLSFTTTATASSAPGSYPIDGGGLTANHGNYNFAQDAGNSTALTISAASTTTALAASPAASVYGQSVTFTATVSLPSGSTGTAAGKVEFIEGANPLPGCSSGVTVSGGAATCTTQALSVAAHHVVATFVPSDGNTTVSAASTDITVSAAATTTTITNAQPWTVSLGASSTVNVTVTANAPGSGTPTGTVTVSNGGSSSGDHCAITLPATSCALTPSSAGTKTVTATYTPDAASNTNFSGSNATASLGVTASQPGTTLISSVDPSVFGQSVTLTGTVTPAAGGVTPTGKVQFFIDGETEICSEATLSSTGTANSVSAACTVPQTNLTVGDHPVRFQYEGDANNNPSSATLLDGSQQTIPQTVNMAQTTTTVTAPASIVLGNLVTIGVSVSANAPGAGTPSGEVAVNVQGQICSVVLDSTGAGSCMLAPQAPAGSKTITASYAGSTNFAASSGTASLQVGAAVTMTTLAASSATTVYGQSVTFTATVSAGEGIVLNGTVAFRDGATVLAGCGAAPLTSGTVQCSTAVLSASTHTISATYTPSDANTAGSSATAGVTVGKAATITSLSAPASITLGNPVVVTATVVVGEPGAGTLIGSVAVGDGDSAAGDRCTIALPATTCTLTPSSAGNKTLTAVYTPDVATSANFTGSSAKPLGLVVGPAAPGTNLVSSINPSAYGQSVTFTATVTPPAGGVIPTGSVVFSDGETPLCSAVNLIAGTGNATAVCTTSTLSVGTHVITARYAGDANNQASNASVTQVVNKADQTLTLPAQTTPSRVLIVNGTFAIAPSATSTTPNSGQPIVYTAKTASVCSVSGTTVAMLTAGTCTIAADQAGDDHYNAAAEVTQNVAIGSAASAITLTASTATPAVDAAVTLNVTVSGQAPTGTVSISDGGTVLCSQVNLATTGNTATASCDTSFATAGNHILTATYAGDANNAAQTSAPLSIGVGLKCAVVALTVTPDHIVVGQSLSLAATVSGCLAPTATGSVHSATASAAPAAAITAATAPTGSVTFYDGTAMLSTAAIDAVGNATLPLSTLSAGTHTLKAVYGGDRAFAQAQAQILVVVDAPASPPVPAPALGRWTLWLFAATIGLIGALVRVRRADRNQDRD